MHIKILSSFNKFVKPFLTKSIFRDERILNRFKKTIQEMFLAQSTELTKVSRNRIDKDKYYKCYYVLIQRFFNNIRWSYDNLRKKYIYLTSSFVRLNQVIAFDYSELIKPKGDKMEYIDYVHDGKDNKQKLGYWISVAAIKTNGVLQLLDFNVFSLLAHGIKSKTEIILDTITKVYSVTKGKGIAVFDREFDNLYIFQVILALKNVFFVIRAKNQRTIILSKKIKGSVLNIENYFYKTAKTFFYKKKKEVYEIAYRKIYLNHIGNLYMVVSRSQTNPKRKWFLYTNQEVLNDLIAKRVVEQYTERWQIEVAIRTLKQEMKIEKLRVRKYDAIRKLVFLSVVCMHISVKYLLHAGKKLIQFIAEKAELYTDEIKHFGIFTGINKIFSEQIDPKEFNDIWFSPG